VEGLYGIKSIKQEIGDCEPGDGVMERVLFIKADLTDVVVIQGKTWALSGQLD
jgi:hypothetical protein